MPNLKKNTLSASFQRYVRKFIRTFALSKRDRSLFKSATTYRQVVEVLAAKNKGLGLKEIKEEIGAGDSDGTEWSGVQIDLLLCRGDHVIDVCDMKYCQSEFVVSGEYEEKLRQRNSTFAHFAKTKDALHTVLVTIYGLNPNIHSGCIYATVTMDELFAEYTR